MEKESNSGIVEAVEALSGIADLELDRDLGFLQKKELKFQDQHVTFKTVEWMSQEERELGIAQVKEVFTKVLRYVRKFYQEQYNHVTNSNAIDGIKTIMVLVGEAAKKIDKYQALFQHNGFKSVTEDPDYKILEDFYRKKIAKVIDEGVLGRWILGITHQVWKPTVGITFQGKRAGVTRHLYMDLESVKKDTDYELFYLRKEDGSRFFSPGLIRNIKLVSDFGGYFSSEERQDFLSELPLWEDHLLKQTAEMIYIQSKPLLDQFFREAYRFKEHKLVGDLSKAIFALMLALNTTPQPVLSEKKRVRGYFSDFLSYLRRVLRSNEFERISQETLKKESTLSKTIVEVSKRLVESLYTHPGALDTLKPYMRHLVEEGKNRLPDHPEEAEKTLSEALSKKWHALSKVMRMHPNGPLKKILRSIEEGDYNRFEPLNVDNVPHRAYDFYLDDRGVSVLRLPSPLIQETTEKAFITPEWRLFMASQKEKGGKHLLVNLQDRTSWKESGRALALEELGEKELGEASVITLAMDTDFYHQTGPYHDLGNWDKFSEALWDQIVDIQAGFHFSEGIKGRLENFVPLAVEHVHNVYFGARKVLSKEDRLSFIDLLYLMIVLKAVELSSATSLSFTCKDALDTGNIMAGYLEAYFELLKNEEASKEFIEGWTTRLFAPPLVTRERLPLHDRLARMIKSLHLLENLRSSLGFENYQKRVRDDFKLLFSTLYNF